MIELLPCPFCGGDADPVDFEHGKVVVICSSCSAETESLEEWNTRAEDPVRAELVEALGHLLQICEDFSGNNITEQRIYKAEILYSKAKGEPQ